jgi:glutamate-1-semialdehyde 2,1-aminomutase
MDYQEVIERKKTIVNSPIRRIPEEAFRKVIEQFHQRNPKSRDYYTQMKAVVPGGLQHNLGSSEPFALTFSKANADKIYDIDGNEYTDYLLDGGPIILGHHFEPLDAEVIKLISVSGPAVGLTHENELRFANEIVKNVPSIEMVRFVASGTEADTLAIRLARVYTGKQKIIKIAGNYHGWSDQLTLSINFPGTGAMDAEGIPQGCYENTIEVNQNDFDGLARVFEENKDNIAAVLVEPTGGHAGTFLTHPDWNQTLRNLCDQNNALLIFDEVVTGFRLSLGCSQAYYNVTPDLTVMGKIISHGYAAAGAVGGKKEIMQYCHPSHVNGKKAFTAGTMSANAVMVTAGYYALKFIKEYQAIEKSADYAAKLTKALNDLFSTRKDLPFFVYNIQSIMHIETSCYNGISLVENPAARFTEALDRYATLQAYALVLMTQGILPLGDRFYCCMGHGEESMQKTIKAWDYLLSLIPVA